MWRIAPVRLAASAANWADVGVERSSDDHRDQGMLKCVQSSGSLPSAQQVGVHEVWVASQCTMAVTAEGLFVSAGTPRMHWSWSHWQSEAKVVGSPWTGLQM